jgi:hypothetical protein
MAVEETFAAIQVQMIQQMEVLTELLSDAGKEENVITLNRAVNSIFIFVDRIHSLHKKLQGSIEVHEHCTRETTEQGELAKIARLEVETELKNIRDDRRKMTQIHEVNVRAHTSERMHIAN